MSIALLAAVALGALAGLWGIRSNGNGSSPQAVLEQVLARRMPAWALTLAVPTGSAVVGQNTTTLRIQSDRPGWLYVLQAGTDGKTLNLIFPNRLDHENHILAGATQLPRPQWRLTASGPAGQGALLAVVVAEPAPDEAAIRHALAVGTTPDFGAQFGAALLTWREVSAQPDVVQH